MDDLARARHRLDRDELHPLHVPDDCGSHPRHAHKSAGRGVDEDDARRGDTAVRALLRGAPSRGAAPAPAQARRGACRGRVPGDVPARAPGVRAPRPRRAPARVGAHDRAERRGRHAPPRASRRPSSSSTASKDAGPRTRSSPSSRTGSPPKERAAVVLRYGYDLSYDQIAAALGSCAGRGPSGRVDGRPAHPKEDLLMTVSPDLDRRFRDAAATLGLDRRRLRRRRLADRRAASSRRPTAGSPRSRSTRDPEEQLERLARIAGPRVLRSPRSVDPARRELDEYFARAPAELRPHARPPCAAAVHDLGARTSSRASPTARRRRTASSPRASAIRAPRAPSAP